MTSTIEYCTAPGGLGLMLLAQRARRGICAVLWLDEGATATGELRRLFPDAALHRQQGLSGALDTLIRASEGRCAIPGDWDLDLEGSTDFQTGVWSLVQAIRPGQTRSYAALAEDLSRGNRHYARAVAGACAANRLALLIPCHRVVRTDGNSGAWRWGQWRRQSLLEQEARQFPQAAH